MPHQKKETARHAGHTQRLPDTCIAKMRRFGMRLCMGMSQPFISEDGEAGGISTATIDWIVLSPQGPSSEEAIGFGAPNAGNIVRITAPG